MKIAIIGPSDSTKRVEKICNEYDNLIANIYNSFTLQESIDVFNEAQMENDGIIFTGPSVFDAINQNKKISKPYEYITYDERAIYAAALDVDLKKYKNISVDVIKEDYLKDIFESIGVNNYSLLSHRHGYSEKDYIKHHDNNIKMGNTLVLTTFSPICKHYLDIGIDAKRLYTSDFTIKGCISSLITKIDNHITDLSKIAIQLIKLKNLEGNNNYIFYEKSLEFEKKLLTYIQKVKGSMFRQGRNSYTIFSTKGHLTNEGSINMFSEIILESYFNIFSGIGIGDSAFDAEYNASKALFHSEESKNSGFYIFDENKNIIGPFYNDSYVEYNSSSNEDAIINASEKAGLSGTYIKKIYSIMSNKDQFTTGELAYLLGISDRSARRIVKKLVDSKLANIVGKEKNSIKGRPNNLVSLNDLDKINE